MANIAVFLPRDLSASWLAFATVLLVSLLGYMLWEKGGKIQQIVVEKTGTRYVRSATIIDFVYAIILFIFKEYNDLKNKIMNAQNKIKNPELNENDSEEEITKKQKLIEDNKKTINKLNDHLKKEADISNMKINELRRFRMLYTTTESLDKLLQNIK